MVDALPARRRVRARTHAGQRQRAARPPAPAAAQVARARRAAAPGRRPVRGGVDGLTPVTGHGPRVAAFVALGSNLADPAAQIRSALRELARLPETSLVRTSSLYRNPPEGGLDQPE